MTEAAPLPIDDALPELRSALETHQSAVLVAPPGAGKTAWTETVLYRFQGGSTDGAYPMAPLAMDAAGNLYDTTIAGGAYQQGSVFKLTQSNGSWTYSTVYDFTNGSDGRSPYGHLIFDANGNLYGTAGWGGSSGNGVVWEITP